LLGLELDFVKSFEPWPAQFCLPKLSLGIVSVGQVPLPIGSLGAVILFWRAGEFNIRDMVGFSLESGPGHYVTSIAVAHASPSQ